MKGRARHQQSGHGASLKQMRCRCCPDLRALLRCQCTAVPSPSLSITLQVQNLLQEFSCSRCTRIFQPSPLHRCSLAAERNPRNVSINHNPAQLIPNLVFAHTRQSREALFCICKQKCVWKGTCYLCLLIERCG